MVEVEETLYRSLSLALSPLPSASSGNSNAIQSNILVLPTLYPRIQATARNSDTFIHFHLESAFPRFNGHRDSRKLYEGAVKKVRIVRGGLETLAM